MQTRFVWRPSNYGPEWRFCESRIDREFHTVAYGLGTTSIWEPERASLTWGESWYKLREGLAGAFYWTANAVEFLSPGISQTPPDVILGGAWLAGIPGAELPVAAVIGVYSVAHFGPDALRTLADWIEP